MDSYSVIANQPIVIDNGSGMIKAGFAGDEVPKCNFRNYVARPKHTRIMQGAIEGDNFIGSVAEDHRGMMAIKYPMEHGIITDWGDMERIWQHIYGKGQLATFKEEHPVLLTEAPLNPYKNREKMAEIFFESFNVPALYVSVQAVLSLYASGRTTGVVLDIGDVVSHSVPIYEGFALKHSITRSDIAGRDITRHLQLLLRKEGHKFITSSEMEVVRQIKEKACFISMLGKEEKEDQNREYQLPDGEKIQIGSSKFKAPEILFNPELIGSEELGVHDLLFNSIRKSDLDLRKTLYNNIVLSGGSTLVRGLGDRLLSELRRPSPKDTKIRISAPQERLYATWIGGSILASLDNFKRIWVTKKEWESEGARALHRKTL